MNSNLEDMLYDLDCKSKDLSDWESEFVQSLRDRLESGRDLTERQIEKLEEIWNRVT